MNKHGTDLLNAEKELATLWKTEEDTLSSLQASSAVAKTHDEVSATKGAVCDTSQQLQQCRRQLARRDQVISRNSLSYTRLCERFQKITDDLEKERPNAQKYRKAAKSNAKLMIDQNRAWQQKNGSLLEILRQSHQAQHNLQKQSEGNSLIVEPLKL